MKGFEFWYQDSHFDDKTGYSSDSFSPDVRTLSDFSIDVISLDKMDFRETVKDLFLSENNSTINVYLDSNVKHMDIIYDLVKKKDDNRILYNFYALVLEYAMDNEELDRSLFY